MKVIFLDIDGVLNPAYHMHALHLYQKYGGVAEDEYGYLFCPHTLEHLTFILEHTNAELVISSTWRKQGLTFMQALWHHRGLPGKIMDITPVLDNMRGKEIAAWLQMNLVKNYVIIDDENYLLPHQLPYLVQTDGNYGLKLSDAHKCIALLNQGHPV